MSGYRLTQFAVSLVCIVFLLAIPAQIRAQNIKDAEPSPSNCAVKRYEPEKTTLPVAISDEEYKSYYSIVTQQSPEDLIVQAQLFLEKNKGSNLRFPIYQNLVTAAIRLNKFDLAFELGRKALVEYPDHVMVMTQLSTVASNTMLMGDLQYADEGRTYACMARTFIESGNMPFGYTLERWRPYREGLLGDIYQALGIFSLLTDCPEDSIDSLTQAAKFNPVQPYTYFLLAKAQVRLYQWGTRKATSCQLTAAKNAKQAETLLDQIARTYAYASVLTESERYKMLHDAIGYDMQILGNALGPSLKDEFARSIDSARSEMDASIAKPPLTASERP